MIQMLLWNHPYIEMESFLQGMTAFETTRGARINVPLGSDIRALGPFAHQSNIHLLLPYWETGHLDLTPRPRSLLEEGISVDQKPTNPEGNKLTPWSHDGGEALGRLANQIIGGHKLTYYPNTLISPKRLRVMIIDHCLNLHTPGWSTDAQTLPVRYRILGNPHSKVIDLQIPTQHGQTCIDPILLALQIVGCQEERLHKISEGIQAFTPNRTNMQGLRCPSPIKSKSTGHFKLSHHSTPADNMIPNKRLTLFLPREEWNETTWEAVCLAKNTEIRMADGTFTIIQNSVGKEIWTDQQGKRKITRIHKFDTVETDPPLLGIGGHWMTDFHFIWGQIDSRWHRAFEIQGVKKTFLRTL